MFKNILVATELVEHCDTPVLIAMQIAKQNDAKLHILHVLESETSKDRRFVKHFRTGEEIFCSTEYQETVKEEIQKSCSGVLGPGVHSEIKVIPGFPWEEISKWAKKDKPGSWYALIKTLYACHNQGQRPQDSITKGYLWRSYPFIC